MSFPYWIVFGCAIAVGCAAIFAGIYMIRENRRMNVPPGFYAFPLAVFALAGVVFGVAWGLVSGS